MSALPLNKEAVEGNQAIAKRTEKLDNAFSAALSIVEKLTLVAAANQNKEQGRF